MTWVSDGCTLAVVGDVSQWTATRSAGEIPPPPYILDRCERGRPKTPITSLRGLLLPILPKCTAKIEWPREMCVTQILCPQHKIIFVPHPPPHPHTPFKFPEVCNYFQKAFLNKAYSALVFSGMRLFCFVHFFKLSWPLSSHPRPCSCVDSLFICSFLLSSLWTHGPCTALFSVITTKHLWQLTREGGSLWLHFKGSQSNIR